MGIEIRIPKRALPALAAALGLTVAGPALAGPPDEEGAKAAVLPFNIDGSLSEADALQLTEKLVDGLQRGEFAVVAPSDVVAAEPAAAGCTDKSCVTKSASATNATHVVRTTITVQDRDYTVALELLDSQGSVLAKTSDGCEICGVADVGGIIEAEAATLKTKLDALASGPSTLKLVSDPAGAVVTIDGEIVGTTPIQDTTVVPGKHVIRVSEEGYIAIEREVTFVEGVQESLGFELEKLPSRLPSRPWGWVSLGAGIATLGGGAFLVWADGRPRRDLQGNCTEDLDKDCEFLFDTRWFGAAALVGGAALTTLGVAILINSSGRNRTKKEKPRPNARFGFGPNSVTLSGQF